MKIFKNKIYVWVTLLVISFAGATISLLNFMAAANLGYDITTKGKTIVSMWGFALLGFVTCFIIFAAITVRAVFSRRSHQ